MKKIVYSRRKKNCPAIFAITTSPGFNTDAEISESRNNYEVYNLLIVNYMTIVKSRQVLTSLSQLETCTDTTFIVQDTVRAVLGVKSIAIASGVSLVFDGGMIAGALTGNTDNPESTLKLVGNFTSVEAPITQIFGDTVTASGYWHIDRAYPQWFDAVASTQSYYTDKPHDCSVAINKAVEMKMSGEVFLPAGVYLVSHTIRLRHGINLIGDSATHTKIADDHKPDPEMVDGWGRATFITPFMVRGESKFTLYQLKKDNVQTNEENSTVSRPVIVAVNIKDNGSNGISAPAADKGYALPMGSVEHIYFYNYNKDAESDNDAAALCLKKADCICCLVAGAFSFRDVMWRNFYRAIKWTEEYNDSKTMYRCYVETTFRGKLRDKLVAPSELPYLIDIRGCGDAMVIDDCHIDRGVYEVEKDNQKTEVQLYKAIAMRTCLGGSIRNSIIHGDIDIEHCTALEFADNHCEFGMQMNIRWSQISIHDNFIEKGRVPNFVVHAMGDVWGESNSTYGVVNFSDNKFVCYNYAYNGDRPPVAEVSEHDILLKTREGVAPYSLELCRNYRITANNDTISFHPTGIMLATQNIDGNGVAGDIRPFTAFNGHSHFLSDRSAIHRGLELEQSRNFNAVPSICIEAWSSTYVEKASTKQASKALAAAVSGAATVSCAFYAYAVMDDKRGLSSELFRLDFKGRASYVCDKTDKNGNTTKVPCGNVYRLRWKGSQLPCIVRLVRKETVLLGKTEYRIAEVPVCGARFLYDNSVSVNGHLWRTPTASELSKIESDITSCNSIPASLHPEFVSAAPGLSAIEFRDDNVTCQASALPTEGSWEQGDIVFNTTEPTNGNPQPGFWIKGGNGWIER